MLLPPQTIQDHSAAIHLRLLRGQPLTREQAGFLLQDDRPLPPGLDAGDAGWITLGRSPESHAELLSLGTGHAASPARSASMLYALRCLLEDMAHRRREGPVPTWKRPPADSLALSYAEELRQIGNEEALRERLRDVLHEPHPMTGFMRLHPWRLLQGCRPETGTTERGWWELTREAVKVRYLVTLCPRGDHPELNAALEAYEAATLRARRLEPGLITTDWHAELRKAVHVRHLGEVAQASWAVWDCLEALFGPPEQRLRAWRTDDPANDVLSATLPFTLPDHGPETPKGDLLRAWLLTRLSGCWDELLGNLRDDHPTLTQFTWLGRLWRTHVPQAPGSAREESVQRLIRWTGADEG